jgi:hypothetical protein
MRGRLLRRCEIPAKDEQLVLSPSALCIPMPHLFCSLVVQLAPASISSFMLFEKCITSFGCISIIESRGYESIHNVYGRSKAEKKGTYLPKTGR